MKNEVVDVTKGFIMLEPLNCGRHTFKVKNKKALYELVVDKNSIDTFLTLKRFSEISYQYEDDGFFRIGTKQLKRFNVTSAFIEDFPKIALGYYYIDKFNLREVGE